MIGNVIPFRKRARSRAEPSLLERPLLWTAKAALTFVLIFPTPSWPRPVRSFLDALARRRTSRPAEPTSRDEPYRSRPPAADEFSSDDDALERAWTKDPPAKP